MSGDRAGRSIGRATGLLAVVARELCWVIPSVAREVSKWRERAASMPDNPIREDALSALEAKRFHTEGAALFATLPLRRDPRLVRLLVAHELIWDFLDTVSERPCKDIVRNGTQLHRALAEAVDPDAAISDYYRYHPWHDDDGYLRALVDTCRETCAALPSFSHVRPLVERHAARAQVQAINHEPDPARRDAQLKAWAARELPHYRELSWFELTAAASSSLTIHALLALAADPDCDEHDVAATHAAYFPWVNLACIMLDSFADLDEDAASGHHSYLAHYTSFDAAAARLRHIVRRSTELAVTLPRGERHAIIPTAMAAMYLSHPHPRSHQLAETTRSILRAPGTLPLVLWPVLRAWRSAREAWTARRDPPWPGSRR